MIAPPNFTLLRAHHVVCPCILYTLESGRNGLITLLRELLEYVQTESRVSRDALNMS